MVFMIAAATLHFVAPTLSAAFGAVSGAIALSATFLGAVRKHVFSVID